MGLPRMATASKRRGRKRRRGAVAPWLPAVSRPSWKVVGLAGIAGVAATGVVVARKRRAHAQLEPDELRERLRDRLAEIDAAGANGAEPAARDAPA